MKQHNRALDFVTLALASMRNGDTKSAVKAFVKAANQPDTVAAIRILETSNAQAFELQAKARVEAKAVATKAVTAAPKVKVKANDEFDLGDDVGSVLDDEDEVEEIEAAEDDLESDEDSDEDVVEEDEGDVEAEFAAVLASMNRKARTVNK